MCGRFVRSSPISSIVDTFHVDSAAADLSASYNIAPSREILIINTSGQRELVKCRWGFLPPWAKDFSEGGMMINARAESLDRKPSFRAAFRKQRCLIVADGFYEWKRKDRKKTPYYVKLKSGGPFGLAGLYNYGKSPDGNGICGCAVITTEANALVSSVHDRMPAIVPVEKVGMWLDPSCEDLGALKEILVPYPPENMEMYRVSSRVNSGSIDSEVNITPMDD
jgi:putative SOS response-associated peptidase YedK